MNLFAHYLLKRVILILKLFIFMGSLQAAEYTILDPEDLITPHQEEILEKSQADILSVQNTLVSYAFYNVMNSKVGTRLNWESGLEKVAIEGNTSDKFHLLICIGIFSQQNTVDIYYKNPPSLEDVNELNTCISSLKQSLGSEPSIDDLLENAPSIINDRLYYLNERPKYEDKEKSTAEETRTQEFIDYIFGLVYIALMVIGPIIAFLIIWYIFASINNRRAHNFPIAPNKAVKKRLGAPHAATSISKTTN